MEQTLSRPRQDSLPKAVAWMMLAILSMTGMAVAMREVTATLNVFEATSVRDLAGMLFLLAVTWSRAGSLAPLAPGNFRLQLLRNTIQFGGQTAWNLSVVLLPLATVFALEFATPLVAVVLAVAFLRERLNGTRVFAMLLGAAGIALVFSPQAGTVDWTMALPLCASVAFALSDIITKKLTATRSASAILFWMCVLQLPMNLAFSKWGFWERIDGSTVLPLAVLCVAGFLGHFSMTKALSHADASVVVPLNFLRLPLAVVVGAVFYAEFPSWVMLGGAALLLAAVAVNLAGKAKTPPTG